MHATLDFHGIINLYGKLETGDQESENIINIILTK